MKRGAMILFILLVIQVYSLLLEAKTFDGFKETPKAVLTTMTAPVAKIVEAEKSVKIVMAEHAALYTFPKASLTAEVKSALETSIKNKTDITITYDAATRDIVKIETKDSK
jgi:uncharacterized membrane protein